MCPPLTCRYPGAALLLGTWSRRHQLPLADTLSVEVAVSRALPLITTDGRFAQFRSRRLWARDR